MSQKDPFYADVMAIHSGVTGSCNLVIARLPSGKKIRFIVDCGLFQEEEYASLNYELPFCPANIDFALVTHNHVDHTGQLPLLVRKGYQGPIYMSDVTAQILSPALNDSYKVLKEKAEHENKPLIYTVNDVYDVINQRVGKKFYETFSPMENVKVTFLKNGHLIGAALILVQISYKSTEDFIYEDINLLFTGDYKKENVFFDVEEIPKWIKKLPLTIIQEATYGDIDTTDIEYKFEDNIIEAAKLHKQVFIPAFSQGRFQEMMLTLKVMQQNSQLPETIPIFLDGNLAFQYTNLFLRKELGIKEECKDFVPANSIFVDETIRRNVISDSEPKIIISTSGMASYGPARTYLPALTCKKNALIHFTGYNAEGTLGRRVLDCEEGEEVTIGGVPIKKLAEVQNTREFSGHAKADEMIEFLKGFENIKFILINHGEEETKKKFMDRVQKEIDPKDVDILDRDYFFRINAYGFMKKIQTKK